MAASRKRKVVSIRKYRRSVNIGVILFVMISVYVLIYTITYLSKERISIYEVTVQGSITKEEQYTGIILRDETVYTANAAGYINFYLREGSRAAIGDLIYTLDESGHISDLLFAENSQGLKDSDLSELKKDISSYSSNFDAMNFDVIYDFKVDLDYSVLEIAGQNNIANLDQILSGQQVGFFQKNTADATGTVAYYTDGMEGLTRETITPEAFQMENYKRTSVKSSDLLESGNAAYKLIKINHWTLICPIAQLSFDRHMLRYLSDRYLTFEIVENIETGLKIPISAVTEKNFYTIPVEYLAKADTGNVFYLETYDQNGTAVTKNVEARIYQETENFYYVDQSSFEVGDTLIKPDSNDHYKIGLTSPLKGVFSVNQGYTIFRQIEILSESEEYYIIKTDTPYGLSLYDHIILNSRTVEENQVIYQ